MMMDLVNRENGWWPFRGMLPLKVYIHKDDWGHVIYCVAPVTIGLIEFLGQIVILLSICPVNGAAHHEDFKKDCIPEAWFCFRISFPKRMFDD